MKFQGSWRTAAGGQTPGSWGGREGVQESGGGGPRPDPGVRWALPDPNRPSGGDVNTGFQVSSQAPTLEWWGLGEA